MGRFIANRRGRADGRFRYRSKGNMAAVSAEYGLAGWLAAPGGFDPAQSGAARAGAAAASEPVSRPDAVVLVVPDRTAQLAPYLGSAATSCIPVGIRSGECCRQD